MSTGDPICPICGGIYGACFCLTKTEVFRGPEWLWKDRRHILEPLPKQLFDLLREELNSTELAIIFEDAVRILSAKNADYSSESDRIRNFRKTAEKTGVSMEKVWLVYFSKGMDAIERYCRDGELSSEKIRERIMDAMNYMALLWLIVNDKKEGG